MYGGQASPMLPVTGGGLLLGSVSPTALIVLSGLAITIGILLMVRSRVLARAADGAEV